MRRYNRFAKFTLSPPQADEGLTARWIKLSAFILFAGIIALGYGGLCADYGLTSKSTSGSSGIPIAPTGLSATTVSASQIDLAWTDNSRVEKGFNIERKIGAGGSYQYLATVPSDTAYYSDTGLTDGTVYYYRIYAYNDTNKVVYSDEASATTVFNAPSALNILLVSSFRLDLGWTDNSNSEDGYKIERKSNENPTYVQITIVPANTVTYSDTTVIDGMTYYYQVRAYNATGDSNYSNEASQSITVNAPTGLIASTVSSTQTNLAWTDNSYNEDGFKIERKDSGAYAQIDTAAVNITSYANTGLTTETTYYYRVRTYNAGLGDSTYSNEVSVTTLNPPTAITTTLISSSQINLEWDDNSALETGFKVERKTGISGTYATALTVGANITNTPNTGLTDGTAYYYKVRAYNASGNSSYSPESTVITTPLNAPVSLTATVVSPNQINLAWTDTSGAEELFKIERNSVEIATVGPNITSYPNIGLTVDTTYTYCVRAYNTAYGNSTYSNVITVTTLNTPGSLTATAVSASTVALTWTDTSGVEDGFRIERKTGAGSYVEINTVITGTQVYSDATGLLEGTTYYYRVCAYKGTNNSAYSNQVSTNTLLNEPTVLSATAVSHADINLTWQDNTTKETYYKIERKEGVAGSYALNAILSADTESYTDPVGLNEGTTYYYRVKAYNASVDSAWSNEAFDMTLPAAPDSLSVNVISPTAVVLVWSDKSSMEDGFKIERNAGGGYIQIDTVITNTTTYTNTSLSAETPYYYRVQSYKGSLNSIYSNEFLSVILNAPGALTATAISASQTVITWTDNSGYESGYKIERKTGGAGVYSEIGMVGTNITTYNNSGLSGETNYYYRAKAFNASGNSGFSNETPVTTVLNAPSSLIATVISPTAVTLNWTDNSGVESSFEIERKEGLGSYSPISTVAANSISYADSGLTTGLTYYYRVRAKKGSENSSYSNEVSATPQITPLQDAIDNYLTLATGGNANWFRQTTYTHDGSDAAQSGDINDSQSTYLQASISGPGTLSFWWRVSSESGWDYLRFYIDSAERAEISGTLGGWEQKTYFIPSGTHTIKWEYSKDSIITVPSDCGWVDEVGFTPQADITLAEAVDNITQTWTSGGSAIWFGQAITSYFGGDAAQSGYIDDLQSTYFETTVNGPGVVTYYWKVSSESFGDYLRLYVDGLQQTSISGEIDWQLVTRTITSGTHTIRWTYSKDSSSVSGSDCGWVDKISYAATGLSLEEAVDNLSLAISTAGNAEWFGQTTTYYSGGDAARSGAISDGQESYMEIIVTGGTISFWWKASSESGADELEFWIGNQRETSISGETGWQYISRSISGNKTLKWRYVKDATGSSGSDCGWVDLIEYTP